MGSVSSKELTRMLEKLLRANVVPKAILLSGGGNDVAGDEFGMLLNHERSPVRGLNGQVLAGVIDERVRSADADRPGCCHRGVRRAHRPPPADPGSRV